MKHTGSCGFFFAAFFILFGTFSCTSPGREKMDDTTDSVDVPSFSIEVKLSRRADKKLKADHETIVVAAYFSGIPKDTTRREYQDEGSVPLGSRTVELPGEGIAKFEGTRISRAEFDALADKNYRVLINVYSGRKSSDLNLLNCEILSEPISKVRGTKHVLNGDLIE